MSFGFRQPYQVLGTHTTLQPGRRSLHLNPAFITVDSEMCKAAVLQKLDFAKQLHTVLQGEVKLSAISTLLMVNRKQRRLF